MMRDNRDAKLMARAMRDELAAKGFAITTGESLEIVSRMFGVADWNTLSALIQKREPVASLDPAAAGTTQASPAIGEVVVAPEILERYVGHYRLGSGTVLTVTRDERQLSAQLPGQAAFPIYPSSATEFFYKVVDAQIRFVVDADGRVASAILRQNGADFALNRIDAAAAAQIADRTNTKFESQIQNPETEPALRRLIAEIASGAPNYAIMSPALADATRAQLPRLQPSIASLGEVTSARFLGVSRQGADAYSVGHENGAMHWHIALDDKGIVTMALVTAGP